jgi:hypothetical protein
VSIKTDRGCRGLDRMVVGFTTTCGIIAYLNMLWRMLNIWFGWFMVFNATFNNISVILRRSVLLMEETRVPGKNHRPVGVIIIA